MLAAFALLALAFSPPTLHVPASQHRARCIGMKAVNINGNFPVTEALAEYANQKLSKPIQKFSSMLNGVPELHLKVESRANDVDRKGKESHVAEVTAFCVDKHVITAKSESDDMYAALDELTDTLTRSLRKYKEKKVDIKETRKRSAKDELATVVLEDEE
ncbi:hypothetical protein AB1Y20_003707 [Prymnesium parvum]|uniref:Ribosomal subunit interface protein n=1 Tax=Prymnesium parvum TaxID=97485 RepID=A0AB34J4M6_PRYPA|mmetsp:Transcript_16998/g.42766  ORF Transcript_16998/g.42766 Transcript_16998/m.42766 type:complete len:160 (+) Transcript_16998:43-522(+)